MIKIILNGEEVEIYANKTISDLISDFELDIKKIAIEKDLEIIDPKNFSKILIDEGSRIEIVHFIGGG